MKRKKIVFISFFSILCLAVSILIVSLCVKEKNDDSNTHYQALPNPVEKLSYYNSDLFPIEKVEKSTTEAVELSTLYTLGDRGKIELNETAYESFDSSKVINISSAMDLYAFSCLSNEYKTDGTYPFLTYNYHLTHNIDYDDCVFEFFPIGYTSTSGFSGIFNGNGYEISNLDFENITEYNKENYDKIEYFAMFPLVAQDAQISNFGIINPMIDNLVKPASLIGTAVVAGVNYGHIGYVFVRDLRDIGGNSGINAAGQGRISFLVGKNGSNENKVGSIENCYVATTIVVSLETNDYLDFNELLVENYATIENLYYFNNSIANYSSTDETEDVEYFGIGITYVGRVKYGTRCESLERLTTSLLSLEDDNGVKHWKDETSYGVTSTTFDIETPITRGIEHETTDNKLFYIDDEMDFAYMFELMNDSSYFASNQFTYEIRADIDLSLINPDAYFYGKSIAATIKGKQKETGSYDSVTFNGDEKSVYPTIFNPVFKNYALNEGVECYGIFPYLSGIVQDLNVAITSDSYTFSYITTNEDSKPSSNTKAIGFVSGLVDGGLVKNVNVFAKHVKLNDKINRYYFGSIAGIISGGAAIQKVTAKLSFNDAIQDSINNSSAYDEGIALGGIVGFITKTYGNVYHALSCVDFNLNLKSTCDASVGGIIGSGYTRDYNTNKTSRLENRGSILVNNTASAINLYVSGIIAHHLGIQDGVTLFNNIGDITLHTTGSVNTYVSGVSNVDLVTLNNSSNLKEEGIFKYEASGFTNASNINITSSTGNVYYAGVLNIHSTNFTSEINNMYNLGYQTISGTNTYLTPQIIEMSAASSYAGVINNIGGSTNYKVNANIIYNFRDITLKNDDVVSGKELFYSAVMLGGNINYTDVRNEGDISINLIEAFNNSDTVDNTLNVMGVFDTLSQECYASEIFNGGNITITDKNEKTKNLNINVTGIVRLNNSVITADEQNPLLSSFDNTLVGSLDKVINNGNILITSDNYDKVNVTAEEHKADDTTEEKTMNINLVGNINAAGIAYKNSGIISNAFNLGNITLDIYAKTATEYHAGGIVCVQADPYQVQFDHQPAELTEQYAQIRDSANNGEIQLINMSKVAAKLNAGGIIAKNVDNFDVSWSRNSNQIIAFTINYGSVVVFNAHENNKQNGDRLIDTYAMAGGIIGFGFCNTVNVVNYGNIYSSEASGGIICIANLENFGIFDANLANTINYGNVYAIRKYYSDAGNLIYLPYEKIITLASQYITTGEQSIQAQYVGAIVAIMQFSTYDISIRYLINFYPAAAIVSKEFKSAGRNIDTSSFITTRGSSDTFGGSSVKYAPLSTVSDELGNIGVFSEEFVFRKAINGIGLVESEVTDKYITDYFAFIRFDKINDILLDKIGWRAVAYGDAATQFAKKLTVLSTLLNDGDTELVSKAMENKTWLSNCDTEIVQSVIKESLKTGKLTADNLKSILNYILFSSDAQTAISSSLRTSIISVIFQYYDQSENEDYYSLLQKLLYDELLAKVVAENDVNYKAILTKVQAIIAKATDQELKEVLDAYIGELLNDTSNEILSPLFNFNEYNEYYLTKRMNLIQTLIDGFSDETLNVIYNNILSESNSENVDSLKYQMYLQEHPTEAVKIYSALFTANSITDNESYKNALNTMLSKYDIVNTIDHDDKFNITNMDDNNTSLTGSAYINGEAVSCEKNYTELWNIIKEDQNIQTYISTNYFRNITDPTTSINYSALIAKATEYNNTYQTQDKPKEYDPDNPKSGIYRTKDKNGEIKNRFIYTPDSVNNEATYYYGPFNPDGSIWNQNVMRYKNPGYNQGYDIYANQKTSGTEKTYFPFFITTNEEIAKNQVAKSNKTEKFGYKPFVWNDIGKNNKDWETDSSCQWVSDYILKRQADDITCILYKNYNNGPYIVDYYDFSPGKVYTQSFEATTTNKCPHPEHKNEDGTFVENISLSENNNSSYWHSQTSTNNPHEDDFLKGYATSDTITGIWCMFDLWFDTWGRKIPIGAYITSKESPQIHYDKNGQEEYRNNYDADGGYSGTHTTLYTYYQIKDLVKLDGIRTKGKNTGTADTDEISIISALMAKILSTDAGKKVVLRALASYRALNPIDNNNITNMLTSAIEGTAVAGQAITEVFATLPSESLSAIIYSKTNSGAGGGTDGNIISLKQYLDSLIPTDDQYKPAQKIKLLASSDMNSFKKLLNIVFKNPPGNNAADRSDMIAAIEVLFPSMYNRNNSYNSGKEYYIFKNTTISGITDDDLKDIIKLLAEASYDSQSSILGQLIDNLDSSYYDDLILKLEELGLGSYAADKIWDIAKTNATNYADIIKLLSAAYVGNDYLECENKLLSSEIYKILNTYKNGDYQFIISDTSVDSNKFLELAVQIGLTSNIDGFGIYAMSSSTGIKDGIFIPDNFVLEDMDAKYEIESNHITLTNVEKSDWRGKYGNNEPANSSVQYAFDTEMKQLKKSIATTIFTLNLGVKDSSNNDLVLYSSPELINLKDHTITYYIPDGLNLSTDTTNNTTNTTIKNLVMANKATANKKVDDTLVLTKSDNQYVLENAITVNAEDGIENANYTIIIQKVSMSFNLTPATSTVESGRLELNVTPVTSDEGAVLKLPANLDLTPFITIKDTSTNKVVDSYNIEKNCYEFFELSKEDGNHVIDQNGSAVINMFILDTLKAGTYELTLSVYGTSKTVEFTKPANEATEITDVQFNGQPIELVAGRTVISEVPFGIAYDDTDLKDYNYLDHVPTISPGAKVTITVSKGDVENSNRIYYDIVYAIQSEGGGEPVRYTHRLQEKAPFNVGDTYVELFRDGASERTCVYSESDNQITAAYARNEGNPTYRVKFNMDNFFYGDTTTFTHTPEAETGVAVDSGLSEGLSVTISKNADCKPYSYSYVYDSYGTWDGEVYHRTYEFPALVITKEKSKDAALSKLTFLDDYSRLSGENTVVNPSYAILPENPSASDNPYQDDNIDSKECYYENVKNENPKKITVKSDTIEYNSSGEEMDYNSYDPESEYFTNHFYAVGIVSNTLLGHYAPTMAIEEHAEIYQYITQNMINNYGSGKTTTQTDTALLNDTSDIYIYVPFVKESEKDNHIENKTITTLLVKLNNGQWQEVYEPSFYTNGTAAIGNMAGSKNTAITIAGESYVVDSSAGKPTDNQSLYMDFVGTPKVNHFWYVSYIVFSENYLADENIGNENFNNPYYKAYHISMIDQSNNVVYEISIKAPENYEVQALYLNINVNKYNDENGTLVFAESRQISANANKDEVSRYEGYSSYSLNRSLQILPSGYYYFYVALPEGYSAKYTVSMANINQNESEKGAYLPPSSIVTQRIKLEIEIYANEESDGKVWGVSTQTNYIRLIKPATEIEDTSTPNSEGE